MDTGASVDALGNISELLRLQKYHKKTRRELQVRLSRLQVANEIQQRLLLTHAKLQTCLAECIRTGDKEEFSHSFDAFTRLRADALDLTRVQSLSDSEGVKPDYTSSFLHRVSARSCDAVLSFLSDLIHDANHLTRLVLSLDQAQLEHLTATPGIAQAHSRSVLDTPTASPKRHTSSFNPSRHEHKQIAEVENLGRKDALSLLFNLVGSFPGTAEPVARRQEKAWAQVCASLLADNRPGHERFIVTVLNRMTYNDRHLGRNALEQWIKEALQDGKSLVALNARAMFVQRLETSAQDKTTDNETFYLPAVRRLFACLKNNSETQIIPQRALNLCQSIIRRLKEDKAKIASALAFFAAHWLFESFLAEAITTPEGHGMLLDEYFTETSRHRILYETVSLAQRIVIDVAYSWNYNRSVDPSIKADVDAIMNLFRPAPSGGRDAHGQVPPPQAPDKNDIHLRSVCPSDIMTMIEALYPVKRGIHSQIPDRLTSSFVPAARSLEPGSVVFPWASRTNVHDSSLPKDSASAGESIHSVDCQTDTKGTLGADDANSKKHNDSLEEGLILQSACKELSKLNSSVSLTLDPSQESWSLLAIDHTKVSIVDAARLLAADQTEPRSSDGEGNIFRKSRDTNETYLYIRKSLFKVLADHTVTVSSASLSHSHNKSSLNFAQWGQTVAAHAQERTRKSSIDSLVQDSKRTWPDAAPGASKDDDVPENLLSRLLESAVRQMQRAQDYTAAFDYTCTLDKLEGLCSSVPDAESRMLQCFIKDLERSTSRSRNVATRLKDLVTRLEQNCQENEARLTAMSIMARETRIKMWYCTDVRMASAFADLERLVSALQSMGSAPQRPTKKDDPPVLRHKGTLKPQKMDAIKRGEASVLDIMVADPAYRVVGKLKDDQVALIQLWLEDFNIENICTGEERLHRLLCEASKCLRQLLNADPMVSPVLWGSELFHKDRLDGENEAFQVERKNESRSIDATLSRPGSSASFVNLDPFAGFYHASDGGMRSVSTSTTGSSVSRSPTAITGSSTNFWSPAGLRSMSPLSSISTPSRTWSPIYTRPAISKESFQYTPKVRGLLEEVRPNVTSLLLSDVMQTIFGAGSETDVAYFKGVGAKFAEGLDALPYAGQSGSIPMAHGHRSVRSDGDLTVELSSSPKDALTARRDTLDYGSRKDPRTMSSIFNLEQAKERLVRKFDMARSPYVKLQVLRDLETLLIAAAPQQPTQTAQKKRTSWEDMTPRASNDQLRSQADYFRRERQSSPKDTSDQNDSAVLFENLFRRRSTRPAHLFRDLQTIASLVPVETLDSTALGKAFWSATTAALRIKQALTQELVKEADRVISRYTNSTGFDAVSNFASLTMNSTSHLTGPAPTVEKASPQAAFELLRVAAAQSHPVAQRELAMLYLTHPESLPRVLPPLSKCSNVFRTDRLRENTDDRKHDRETMCVALHWMKSSAEGGDAVAKAFLEGRGA